MCTCCSYTTRQVSTGPAGVLCVALDDESDGSLYGGFDDGFLRCYEAGSGVRICHNSEPCPSAPFPRARTSYPMWCAS